MVIVTITIFSTILGSIPWFYTTELFDQASASWALGISVLVNWLSNFSVGLLFPLMQVRLLTSPSPLA